jgi:hypothetical protein
MNDIYKAQVIAHEEKLLEAMKTSNVELLEELLHDDLLFDTPDGKTATKTIDLDNYRSGNIHLRVIEASDRILNTIGDNTIVAVTVRIEGSYLGQKINGKFRYLRVWKLCGDVWKIIAGSAIAIEAKGEQ